MRAVQTTIIVALSLTVVYLYATNQSRVASLTRRISELEERSRKLVDEYETRIGRLRAGQDLGDRPVARPAPTGPLVDLMGRAAGAALRSQRATLNEISVALGLDPDQERTMLTILEEFRRERAHIYQQAASGGRLPFDEKSLELVQQARQSALEQLTRALRPEQHRLLLDRRYDEALGLRRIDPVPSPGS